MRAVFEGLLANSKFRFLLVGAVNTGIDFGILNLLVHLGVPLLPANIVSTSVALCFSFVANKKFTFKASGGSVWKQALLFLGFTLFGLWVIQGAILHLAQWAFPDFMNTFVGLNVAKLVATVFSLIWNYLTYDRIVFRESADPTEDPR
ncbi:MAG: GtrA family protein [Cellulomonadaceae bacterium]|jgi:putative flippase GtrA|nr:GtrA family protein [Cellulomonadaceae bacterium]